MVGVCALVKASGGQCEDVRIGLTHMAATPLRASAAEEALRGGPLDAERIAAAAEQAADGTDPPGDLNATPDYKRHLARTLTRRALEQAAAARRLSDAPAPTRRPCAALAGRAISPTSRWRSPSFSRSRSNTAACSRARPASARPRPRRRSRRRRARA